jgi:taurine dioxygenase
LTVHPFVPHLGEFPEVVVLDNHADNPVFSTDHWHSDETFRAIPPMGSILRCLVRPETGGETLWCDMVAAYEGLSEKMRRFLSGLEAVHDFKNFRHKFDHLPPRERHARLAEMEEELPNPAHPVVRTHPVTKRKALFVNEQFTIGIKDMREDESRALLDFLFAQARIPEYQFRFHWEVNSMVFWDNAPLQHYAANDYYPQRRTMHRVTIKGDKPF